METKPNEINPIPEEVEKNKFYNNPFRGTSIAKVRGTCRQGCYIGSINKDYLQTCAFKSNNSFYHYEHADMTCAETITKQKEDRDGFTLSLLIGIGNSMIDSFINIITNLKTLFKKLDEMARILNGLPGKKEYEEDRKDQKQILALLKLLAIKSGMSKDDVDNMRPREYHPLDQQNVEELDTEEKND